MTNALTKQSIHKFIDDAAHVMNNVMTVDDVAAKNSMTVPETLGRLDDPIVIKEVLRRAVELERDGTSYQLAAMAGLGRSIAQLNANLAGGELSHTAVLRTGEFFHQVSGLQARTAAMARATEPPPREKFSVVIDFGDRQVVIGDHITEDAQVIDAIESPRNTLPDVVESDDATVAGVSAGKAKPRKDVTAADLCFPEFIREARHAE